MIPLLKKGDKIGLILSSNSLNLNLKKSFLNSIKMFKNLKLDLIIPKNYLTMIKKNKKQDNIDTPKKRVFQLNKFLKDEKIKAIINLWGGYNSNDLLNLIDWNSIKNKKKLIIGASDFTAILNSVYSKTGKTSYHWINTLWYSLKRYKMSKISFKSYFLEGKRNSLFIFSEPLVVKKGKGEGVLVGGNLETFERLICTEFFPIKKDKSYIFFFEDIGKSILEIRAIIQHFILCKLFNTCNGIILGHFAFNFNNKDFKLDFEISLMIKNLLKNYKFPIIYTKFIGHEVPNEILPIGSKVMINTYKKKYVEVIN